MTRRGSRVRNRQPFGQSHNQAEASELMDLLVGATESVLERMNAAEDNSLRAIMAAAGVEDMFRADLRGANLRDQNLSKLNFVGADFSNADLRGTNFSSCQLQGARFTGARIKGANFNFAEFDRAKALADAHTEELSDRLIRFARRLRFWARPSAESDSSVARS